MAKSGGRLGRHSDATSSNDSLTTIEEGTPASTVATPYSRPSAVSTVGGRRRAFSGDSGNTDGTIGSKFQQDYDAYFKEAYGNHHKDEMPLEKHSLGNALRAAAKNHDRTKGPFSVISFGGGDERMWNTFREELDKVDGPSIYINVDVSAEGQNSCFQRLVREGYTVVSDTPPKACMNMETGQLAYFVIADYMPSPEDIEGYCTLADGLAKRCLGYELEGPLRPNCFVSWYGPLSHTADLRKQKTLLGNYLSKMDEEAIAVISYPTKERKVVAQAKYHAYHGIDFMHKMECLSTEVRKMARSTTRIPHVEADFLNPNGETPEYVQRMQVLEFTSTDDLIAAFGLASKDDTSAPSSEDVAASETLAAILGDDCEVVVEGTMVIINNHKAAFTDGQLTALQELSGEYCRARGPLDFMREEAERWYAECERMREVTSDIYAREKSTAATVSPTAPTLHSLTPGHPQAKDTTALRLKYDLGKEAYRLRVTEETKEFAELCKLGRMEGVKIEAGTEDEVEWLYISSTPEKTSKQQLLVRILELQGAAIHLDMQEAEARIRAYAEGEKDDVSLNAIISTCRQIEKAEAAREAALIEQERILRKEIALKAELETTIANLEAAIPDLEAAIAQEAVKIEQLTKQIEAARDEAAAKELLTQKEAHEKTIEELQTQQREHPGTIQQKKKELAKLVRPDVEAELTVIQEKYSEGGVVYPIRVGLMLDRLKKDKLSADEIDLLVTRLGEVTSHEFTSRATLSIPCVHALEEVQEEKSSVDLEEVVILKVGNGNNAASLARSCQVVFGDLLHVSGAKDVVAFSPGKEAGVSFELFDALDSLKRVTTGPLRRACLVPSEEDLAMMPGVADRRAYAAVEAAYGICCQLHAPLPKTPDALFDGSTTKQSEAVQFCLAMLHGNMQNFTSADFVRVATGEAVKTPPTPESLAQTAQLEALLKADKVVIKTTPVLELRSLLDGVARCGGVKYSPPASGMAPTIPYYPLTEEEAEWVFDQPGFAELTFRKGTPSDTEKEHYQRLQHYHRKQASHLRKTQEELCRLEEAINPNPEEIYGAVACLWVDFSEIDAIVTQCYRNFAAGKSEELTGGAAQKVLQESAEKEMKSYVGETLRRTRDLPTGVDFYNAMAELIKELQSDLEIEQAKLETLQGKAEEIQRRLLTEKQIMVESLRATCDFATLSRKIEPIIQRDCKVTYGLIVPQEKDGKASAASTSSPKSNMTSAEKRELQAKLDDAEMAMICFHTTDPSIDQMAALCRYMHQHQTASIAKKHRSKALQSEIAYSNLYPTAGAKAADTLPTFITQYDSMASHADELYPELQAVNWEEASLRLQRFDARQSTEYSSSRKADYRCAVYARGDTAAAQAALHSVQAEPWMNLSPELTDERAEVLAR
jgi:hypothetical protein